MYKVGRLMRVQKRNGNLEDVSFDKILTRINSLAYGEEFNHKLDIDTTKVAQKVIQEIFDGVKTSELDILTSEIAIAMYSINPQYATLASRILVSNHHKNTHNTFSQKVEELYTFEKPLLNKNFYDLVQANKELIDSKIDYSKDYLFDFFGLKTLEKSYLYKIKNVIIERPQDMIMRVCLSIHRHDLDKAFESYDYMSEHYFTHATPTLFNAGSNREQFASCFLLSMKEDSIDGIYKTLKDCALISQHSGGIGLHIHNVRAKDSFIAGTNGKSNGIVPMLRVFNDTARYVDQCVTPETIIYTTEGPKQIQDCEYGKTRIFTTEGPEVIGNVLEHSYEGDIYEIDTMHSLEPLKITDEHPVYCLKDQKRGLNYSVIKNRLEKELIKPTWESVKDLTEDDLLLLQIPTYENDDETISEEDCYMYGLILGDGCMYPSSTHCYLSLHSETKKHIIDSATNYLTRKCVDNYCVVEELTTRVYWKKNTQLVFRHCDIYDINKEKHITEKWINLPLKKAKHIIRGLIDTDGCRGKELVFDSTSRNLIESIRYLLLRMGIPTSGYIRDRRGESHISKHGDRIENKKIAYTLRIPKTDEICELLNIEKGTFTKYFTFDRYIATRIKSIKQSQYEGILYDLQMKETHNYMLHNCIVHNGGGKRNGSFAMYLEPWHADIFEFLELRKNHGNELERARDLFYALWIPDLFMEKVEKDEEWHLFCPNEAVNLSDYYGEDFVHKYDSLVQQGLYREIVSARKLWSAILTSQIETGTPYLLYKDACNSKSNQKNLGVIKSSNLCTEIMEYSDKDETAVCNLASISLKKFVVPKDKTDLILRIYSKPGCIYCDMAEKYCLRYDIHYEKLSYEQLSLVQDKLHGVKFPQIYRIDKNKFQHIGGYTELEEYLRPSFDYDKLVDVTRIVTRNLNNIIDYNYYPTPETKRSNMRHRPIGLGVQGLANVFFEFGIPFESDLAKELNEKIFESIYYGAMLESMNLAKERETKIKILKTGMKQSQETGLTEFVSSDILLSLQKEVNYIQEEMDREQYLGAYSTFMGSPLQQGSFQHNLWGHQSSDRYDWSGLMNDIQRYGVRNSLLVAPMPTASTAQILGNYECFEPVMSNIYTRRVLAGDYMVLNEYLVNDLISLDLWSRDMKDKIIQNDGSIQAIDEIPNHFKARYKTVWEMKQKNIIDMAADRGKYICQSQSMNLFVSSPSTKILTSMHFYSWKKGLKTGIYYLRTRPSSKAIQFTVKPEICEACTG